MNWIQTYSGVAFDVIQPTAEMVTVEDISHALSNICRFTGHCREFYSVAQHSVLVSEHLPAHLQLEGLLHDATEAYCNDIARPLKHSYELRGYKAVEQRIWEAVAERFDLPTGLHPDVKGADNAALFTEQRDLMGRAPKPWKDQCEPWPETIFPLSPKASKSLILSRFADFGYGVKLRAL